MSSPFKAWTLPPDVHLPDMELAGSTGDPPILYPRLSGPHWESLTRHLRRHREDHLLSCPLRGILHSLDRVAGRFQDSHDPMHGKAVEGLMNFAGYSRPMARAVLRGMARSWSRDSLGDLVRSQFSAPEVLDGFWPDPQGGNTRALGFPLAFHLGASTVPGVATTSLIRGLLVKSAVILKPGVGDVVLPALFAAGLQEEDSDLAGSVAVLYWPGGDQERMEAVLSRVDLVVAYGSDATISWVRSRLPPHVPLRAYRHRMGFALVGREALTDEGDGGGARTGAWSVAQKAARAVALFDQKGCVSPQVIFVEEGAGVTVTEWARLLARAFQDLERALPSGRVPPQEAVAIQHLRGSGEVVEAMGGGLILHGGSEAPWTVIVHGDEEVKPSCQNRTVRVVPVGDGEDVLRELKRWTPYLQTVGIQGFGSRAPALRESLARLGVSRVVGLDDAPWPQARWHHDGGDPLRGLVRWTDAEGDAVLNSGDA